MKSINLVVLALFVVVLLFTGCISTEEEGVPPQTGQEGSQESSAANYSGPNETGGEFSYLPLHLEYDFSANTDEDADIETMHVDYYLDRVKECNGEEALMGILLIEDEEREDQTWYKLTVYLDDGSIGLSEALNQGDLLFDGAQSSVPNFDLLLLMNRWFSSDGQNFNGHTVWSGRDPIILHNISAYDDVVDLSIIRAGDKTISGFQCKEFSVAMQFEEGVSSIPTKLCVMEPNDTIPLPFVVSSTNEEGIGGQYELMRMDNEQPPVSYFAECMEFMK